MQKIDVGFPIDLQKLIESRMLIQANSGGGKSYLMRKIMEQIHGKVPFIVIDLEGEFVTLREKYDVIIFGKGHDIPLNVQHADKIAHYLLELSATAIIDLSELQKPERASFVRRFLESMINAPKSLWHPVVVIIDEAHQFCPEDGKVESADAVVDLCTRGRKRGYCAILATQRISSLRKGAVAELNNKVIGRTTLDTDVKRTAFELGMTNTDAKQLLSRLDEGEFYTFGTAISKNIEKHKISSVKTTHVTTGMKLGKITPPSNAIQKLIEKISDIPKEVEEERDLVKHYQQENSGLKKKVHEIEKQLKGKQITVQVPVKDNSEAIELRKHLAESKKKISEHESWQTSAIQVIDILSKNLSEHREKLYGKRPHPMMKAKHITISHQTNKVEMPESTSLHQRTRTISVNNNSHSENGSIAKGEKAVLIACASFTNGLLRTQITVLTQYTRSSRDAYIHRLKTKGYVTTDAGKIKITQEGVDILGHDYQPLPTGDALMQHWLNTLPKGEKIMLELIAGEYPNSMSREELTDKSGYTRSSRDAYLHRMLNKEIIEVTNRGEVKASESLFG